MKFPNKLISKLEKRKENNRFRLLNTSTNLIDFSSNDYLGFSRSKKIFEASHQYLIDNNICENGSTGSRLLSGNHLLYNYAEDMLCQFHASEAGLIFNSGYDANVGFFSSIPQRGDIVFYDELIHASIRDGITMSNATSYKFKHNSLKDLKDKVLRFIENCKNNETESFEVYIVTESVFSMDGDSPNLKALADLCSINNYHLIVDEAHAVGVFGKKGVGLIQSLGIEHQIFARVITFGKALGCHGAAILGSKELKQYLTNFTRNFIYTTALPPHTLVTITEAYKELLITKEIENLRNNISFFKKEIQENNLQQYFIEGQSAIQSCLISENGHVKKMAYQFQDKGFDVKPILSPTVPKELERLRFCLHSYNSHKEIREVLQLLLLLYNK